MAFPDSLVDEIKAQASLSQVVARRVKLTRKGGEFTGQCPFHPDKTPSFTINEAKGFYHCFGCGVHGDVFDFVMRSEGIEFRDVVHRLAGELGLDTGAGSGSGRPAANANCGVSDATRTEAKPDAKPARPDISKLTEPTPAAYTWFAARGISKETVDRNGVRMEGEWIAFPYRRVGEIVNIKYRARGKRFRQVAGAEKIFYGLDDIKDADTAIIVEGEPDKLALEEAGYRNVISCPDGAPAQFRWEGGDRACETHQSITEATVKVCPGCGAQRIDDLPEPDQDKKFTYLWNCRRELDGKRIVLAVDGDGPGRILEEELARRLGRERCWRVSWPSINDAARKDANEVLVEDGADVLRECIESASPYPIASLYGVSAFRDQVVQAYERGRERGLSTGWPGLDDLMSVVLGHLYVITGYPGSGKSEFVDALMVNLAEREGFNVALWSPEHDPAQDHLPKLVEKVARAPFFDGPTMRMERDALDTALDWLQERFNFIVLDDQPPTIETILEKARAAVLRHGIRCLVLDPYNEIEARRPESVTETEYVSNTLSLVKRFARNHGVVVFFVAHPSKPPPATGGEAKAPGLYSISGSAHWVNKPEWGIVVHRGWQSDGTRNRVTEIYVRKVKYRWFGRPGMCELDYTPATGCYVDRQGPPPVHPGHAD